jgi:putative ABC transport system ATP-binding protein
MNARLVKLINVTKRYGSRVVVDRISLEIWRGEFLCFLGPSGSGKTTLLRLLAGLEIPDEGRIEINGATVSADGRNLISPQDRRIGFVFQDLALWPHLTVTGNLDFVLGSLGVPRRARQEKIERALAMVRLNDRATAYPSELSGGEQQRVALARAFVTAPRILFADEPTGNLDSHTGKRIIDLLFQLNREQNTTLVLVTHDPALAERCGRSIKLEAGRLA